MKFLDKVKNMFTEEVVEDEKPKDEVKVEQIIPEKKQEKVTRERATRDSRSYDEFDEIKIPEKKEEKKPVFFTDDDFNDLDNYFKKAEPKRDVRETRSNNNDKFDLHEKYREREEKNTRDTNYGYNNVDIKTEPKKKDYDPLKSATEYLEKYNEENGGVKEPYQGNTKIETKPLKFKPTPIISPVYGILDKNYHKEDIVSKNDKNYKSVDGLSVDSIREKAYGTLEDELENTLFGSNSILFKDENKTKSKKVDTDFFDDLEEEATPTKSETKSDTDLRDLENITMDIGKELDSLLNKDNKEEKKETNSSSFDDDDDLFNLIDTMYDGDDAYDA